MMLLFSESSWSLIIPGSCIQVTCVYLNCTSTPLPPILDSQAFLPTKGRNFTPTHWTHPRANKLNVVCIHPHVSPSALMFYCPWTLREKWGSEENFLMSNWGVQTSVSKLRSTDTQYLFSMHGRQGWQTPFQLSDVGGCPTNQDYWVNLLVY